ncbi:MAG: glycosyltransferase family 4 protein, partial [Firmicutes bacterium]|nr:glycosyltransferase family 4 protein [Bacillota bacterium]
QLEAPAGISVPCGDADALAEAAVALAARRNELREACRSLAQARFDREKAVRAYLAQYHRMIGA